MLFWESVCVDAETLCPASKSRFLLSDFHRWRPCFTQNSIPGSSITKHLQKKPSDFTFRSRHPPSCENNMNQKVLVFLLPNFIFGIFLFGFFCKRQKPLTGAFPDPTEDWLAIQNDRKSTLVSVCLKNNLLKLRSKLDSHVANQLFVEHKHKFMYCEVPKVGCSNWKRTIFLLQADLNAEASEIEHDHIHQTSLIKKLVTYPPAIQKEFLNNYTKVMFTRHPLERLVSAYRDKLLHSEPFYSITVANQIRAMFRKNKNSSEKVSFQEFVNFIIAKPPNTLDIHWKPMFLLCDPCNIHYDILGKYETLGLDSEHVLKVIGAPESLHYPSLKRYGSEKRTNGDITLEYLRQLNSEQIEKIKKLYQMDFFLFNYTMKYEDYFSLND